MSIADKLTTLSAVKAALRSAIEGKGVSVGSTPFTGWPGLISSIPAGGGDAPTGLIDGTVTTLDLSAWPDTGALRAYAFYGCSALTSITLPAGMTGSIGTYALYGCSKLTSITLPAGMTGSIGTYAFGGCSKLTKLVIQRTAGVVTLASANAFGNSGITATTGDIYVPDARVSAYKTATNWSTFAGRIRPLSAYTP